VGWKEMEETLRAACDTGAIPGAVIVVRRGRDIVYEGVFGHRTTFPERSPMRLDTVFDLSSLTKPLATAFAVMTLVRDGKLRLDDRVTRFFHNFGVHQKNLTSFRHLLSHSSGLAAWRPFYQRVAEMEQTGRINFMASRGAREFIYDLIHREKPEALPGTRAIYSDLNFMLLGEVVEQICGMSLNRVCRERIYRPLELRSTDFIDISMTRSRRLEPIPELFAATEICPSRKRLLIGEVHDDNAYAMGGVAGHAGLFAPAREVDRIAAELMNCYAGRSGLIPRAIVQEFWRRDSTVPGSTWALGWDTPSAHGSSAGRHFSSAAVGHLGFTGTSLWIEPDKEIAITLLTNRVHPRRDNQAIREIRPRVHDLAMEALGIGS
jgi:CubicO group peptidase (beta-lactamase class C family)